MGHCGSFRVRSQLQSLPHMIRVLRHTTRASVRSTARSFQLACLPFALSTAAAVLPTSTMSAQSSAMLGPVDGKDLAATDIERVAVGAMAPDFTLAKFGGGTVTLSSMRGKKNVVLIFYRGYWCPYCINQ